MEKTARHHCNLLFAITLAGAALTACVATPVPVVSRSGHQPVVARVESKYVDDDSPPQSVVRFRNLSNTIVSFDYTIADQPGVPHIDREGPNSGFVGNHYPGSEVEVPNPLKRQRVWVTLGRITYGKRRNLPVAKPAATEISLIPDGNPSAAIEPPPLPQTP